MRFPDPRLDLDDLFLLEAKRRVMKDRTVSLHGRLCEVDAVLVGQSVTLRYDPEAPPARPIEVVHDAKQLPVLVIDEAQHLRNDVLDDVWPAPVFHRIDTRSGEPPAGLDRAPCTSVST